MAPFKRHWNYFSLMEKHVGLELGLEEGAGGSVSTNFFALL